MKKILIGSVALVSLLMVGCGKKIDYEAIMKKQATTYYEKYMTGVVGVTAHKVTISMLKNANKVVDAKFDVDKLKKCDDESSVTIVLDSDGKKIKSYEFDMNCK